ncbi:MAG: pre-peptidase [Isosphaeraceae bacterium]
MTHPRLVLAAAWLATFSTAARAQTSYPMVTRVEPAAVQRGTAADLVIGGGGTGGVGGAFTGAFGLLAQPPGLRGEILEGVDPGASNEKTPRARADVKARLHVASDAPLGPREVRVATSQGVSSVGLIVVVDDPVVAEADDAANDGSQGAQELTLPCVVSGKIGKTEDVDWYAFEAKAGSRITFSVWANRLENKIHDLQTHLDPIIALHDPTGREVATDDNHHFADPMLTYEFKSDGRYTLQVRDTTYGGNASWTYVLQATPGPVATSVFPLAVNPGETATLHAEGPNVDPSEAIALEVPTSTPAGPTLVSLPTSRGKTLATPVVVTDLAVVTEVDDAPAEGKDGQVVSLPAAICGRLNAPNDVDTFRFEAKKGQVFAIEVVARRAGAATDPVLRVLNDKEAALAEADDSPGLGKDARLEWTAPADGTFALQIADLHSRGGDGFGYVIQAGPAAQDFTLSCDPDKLNVGPGGRVPLFVQVTRLGGFKGPITVELDQLPEGVGVTPLVIPPAMTQGLMVVSAAPGAKSAAGLLSLKGRGETSGGSITREVTPRQEIYMPGGGRSTYPVETLAIAVTDPSDVAVEASPAAIRLKPGGTATIDVTVTRKPGYDKGVNLAILLQHLGGTHANPLPPGVTVREAGSKTLLGPTETRGTIVLEAKADAAEIENVPICVMGHVSINFVVKTAYASAPIALSVTK